jgi:hypothetical protein
MLEKVVAFVGVYPVPFGLFYWLRWVVGYGAKFQLQTLGFHAQANIVNPSHFFLAKLLIQVRVKVNDQNVPCSQGKVKIHIS